jgi:D-alanyl-D-alanine carboxypeptidase/D-alanyl-D-alanine-endopeptidase (penicillin-binding protein 4)
MYWRKKVQRMFSRKNAKRMFWRMKVQRTIRRAACLLTMAAACLSAPAQSTTDAAKPETVATPLPSAQQPPLTLAQQIAALLADPAVARAHWGVMVTTIDGKPLYALNEAQLFQPASNAKLFTTAAAMALLGPERTFQTKVIAEGTMAADGILHGDLLLRGGGDANFASALFPYLSPSQRPAKDSQVSPSPLAAIDELADQVVAKGLKIVDGDVVGDDSYYAMNP